MKKLITAASIALVLVTGLVPASHAEWRRPGYAGGYVHPHSVYHYGERARMRHWEHRHPYKAAFDRRFR